jgi:hypothetical protein
MSDTAPSKRMRGPNRGRAWSRAVDTGGDVSVIRLPLDTSDPVMRRRVERVFADCHRLRRTLQRQARRRVDAYWSDRINRKADPKATRERYGLTRKSLEAAAKAHLDAAPHLAGGCTKALGLHLADTVWTQVERHLFPDASGRRHGRPKTGRWFDFGRIPGRAKSHTTPRKWETFRLHGTLDAHRAAFVGGNDGFYQPRRMPQPQYEGSWWGYDGPLVVAMTGLGVGELVLPVRLPAAPSNQAHLDHHLAQPERWHKIDLVRFRDPQAAGGWRYEAHLMVLAAPYVAPSTHERRQGAPAVRRGGVDVNVSNITVASHHDGEHLTLDRVARDAGQKRAAAREAKKQRDRNKALDRSRRANNPGQYQPSKAQRRANERRRAQGLPIKEFAPAGPRKTRKDGKPVRAYRRDNLSRTYRRGRAQAAEDAAGRARARRDRARKVAADLVTTHGPNLVVEDCNLTTWARQWGRSLHAFAPGTLVTALDREARAAADTLNVEGGVVRASTRTTALSQRCPCGHRDRKPLGQRTHRCLVCGLVGDRDAVSATLAAFVDVNPGKPQTATLDRQAAREALQHPATWHTLNQTSQRKKGRQDGLSASTANPSPHQPRAGRAVGRPPATAGSARRTPARHPHQPSMSPTRAAGERTGTRTGRSRDGGANAPPLRDIS